MERNYTNGHDQGNIYKLTRTGGEGRLVFNRMNGKLNKICTGLANPGNYFHTSREFLELIHSKGHISFVELREVAESREVEKWVKIDRTTATEKPQKAATSVKEETPAPSVTPEPVIGGTIKTGDDEPATPRQLWALHCATKLNTKELKISKGTASKLIDRSKKGENITEAVRQFRINLERARG